MAYTNATSIFQSNGSTPEELTEAYNALVDQIQKEALSVQVKNADISGDPKSGSVKVRRLETSLVKTYGTARTAAEGDKIKNNGVTVNLDQKKEIVEEVNTLDVQQFGLPDLLNRRKENFAMSVARHLDAAFFTEAESAGTDTDVSDADSIVDKVEMLIQALETVSNDNVDGVDRELMHLFLTPEYYGALENYIDTLPNAAGVKIDTFHKVKVHSNVRQTEDAIIMAVGAIAQPVAMVDFKSGEIPLSNETSMELYFNYGTQAVAADLIMYADLTAEVSA